MQRHNPASLYSLYPVIIIQYRYTIKVQSLTTTLSTWNGELT